MKTQRYRATPNLDRTLERKERSRRWLARKIGVSPGLLFLLVQGARTLSAEKAFLAAAILDEPVEYLFVSTEQNIVDTQEAIPA